jgi:hypothetical protein
LSFATHRSFAADSCLSEDDPAYLLEVVAEEIGHVACAISGSLRRNLFPRGLGPTDHNTLDIWSCSRCDAISNILSTDSFVKLNLFQRLAFLAADRYHDQLRIKFLRSIKRLFRHAPPDDVSLETAEFGVACLRLMSDERSTLGVAAG